MFSRTTIALSTTIPTAKAMPARLITFTVRPMATIADTDANFCNDELLRLTIAFLSGEAVTNSCQVAWIRLIQVQD